MYGCKTEKYKSLVQEVKSSYELYSEKSNDNKKLLYWCEECDEINLWTYWQGRGNLDAKILLVGQDWGNPWNTNSQNFMSKIKSISPGPMLDYMHGNDNPTDLNLVTLFKELDIDISIPSKKVFFTNFVLGYRNYNISGGFKKSWARKDEKYFKKLVNIIEPEIILCLGRATFESVMHAFQDGARINIGKYNSFIESESNPVKKHLKSGHEMSIFALAHCGVIGTMNRNRGQTVGTDKLELQKKDWRRIKPFLK